MNHVKSMRPQGRKHVVAARNLDIKYFVDGRLTKAWRKLITIMWADTNAGDEKKPNHRSRLVGRDPKCSLEKRLWTFGHPVIWSSLLWFHLRAALGMRD